MLSLAKKIFQAKPTAILHKPTQAIPQKAIDLFKIVQDGQGLFLAKTDRENEWLSKYIDLTNFHNRGRWVSFDDCESACKAYILQHEFVHVGTIQVNK